VVIKDCSSPPHPNHRHKDADKPSPPGEERALFGYVLGDVTVLNTTTTDNRKTIYISAQPDSHQRL
jgi:hypothetical protein